MSRFYTKITSRYPAICEVCGKGLQPGEAIAWKRLGRRSYTRCIECMGWARHSKEELLAIQNQEAWDKAQRSWRRMTDHQKNDHELREAVS